MVQYKRSGKFTKIMLLVCIFAVSVLFTALSKNTTQYATNAIRLCAFSVVPSLFPFMVLSAIASKAVAYLTDGSSPVFAVVLSFFLGALCGFPVGAATVAAMHKSGALRRDLAEGLCALCNNTGPAFAIGVIGNNFWMSSGIGIMFYICQLTSAAVVFGIWRLVFYKSKNHRASASAKDAKYRIFPLSSPHSANAVDGFSRIFCLSVGESVISVLQICGYIVFFKVICDTVGFFMPDSSAFGVIYTILASLLEFTSGSNAAASLGGAAGVALCGFTVGFSGLSVIAQSAGILTKSDLSVKLFFIMKFFIGIITAILSYTAYSVFDFSRSASVITNPRGPYVMLCISVGIIVIALIITVVQKTVKHNIHQS